MKKRFQVTSFYTESLNGQLNLVEGVDGIINVTPPAIQDNKDFYMIIDPLNKTGDRIVLRCYVGGGVINYYGWSFFGNHIYFEGTDIQINDVAELFNEAYQHIDDFGFVERTGSLDVIARGGRVINNSLTDTVISDQELTLPDNSTSYIYFDNVNNEFNFSNIKKTSFLACAKVITLAGEISSIDDLRANWIGVGTELQRLTQTEINNIPDKRDGMMVLNTTTGLPQYYSGGHWFDVSTGTVTPRATELVEGKVRVQTDQEFEDGDDVGADDATLVSKPSKVKTFVLEEIDEKIGLTESVLSNEDFLSGEQISKGDSLFCEIIEEFNDDVTIENHGIAQATSGATTAVGTLVFFTKKDTVLKTVYRGAGCTATRAQITVGGTTYTASFVDGVADFGYVFLRGLTSYTLNTDNSGASYTRIYNSSSSTYYGELYDFYAIQPYNVSGLGFVEGGEYLQDQLVGASTGTTRYCYRILFNGDEGNTIDLILRKTGTPVLDLNVRIESDEDGLPTGELIKPGYIGTLSEGLLTTVYDKKTITFGSTVSEARGTIGRIVLSQGPSGSEVVSAGNHYVLGVSERKSSTRYGMSFDGSIWSFGGVQQNGILTPFYEDMGGYTSSTDSNIKWGGYSIGISTSFFSNGYRSVNTISSSDIFVSALMTADAGSYYSSGVVEGGLFIRYDNDNYIKVGKYSLRSGGITSGVTTIDIVQGGTSVYSFTNNDAYTKHNRISKIGNNISIHQRSGTAWVQLGVTQTVAFTGEPKIRYTTSGNSLAGNSPEVIINTPIIAYSTYTTLYPITTDNLNFYEGDWCETSLLAKTSALYTYKLPETRMVSVDDYDIGEVVKYDFHGITKHIGLPEKNRTVYLSDSPGVANYEEGTYRFIFGKTIKENELLLGFTEKKAIVTSTRDVSATSATVTYTHNLGKIPEYIRLETRAANSNDGYGAFDIKSNTKYFFGGASTTGYSTERYNIVLGTQSSGNVGLITNINSNSFDIVWTKVATPSTVVYNVVAIVE